MPIPDVPEAAAGDRAAAAQPPQPVPDAVQLLARGLHEAAAAHLRAEVVPPEAGHDGRVGQLLGQGHQDARQEGPPHRLHGNLLAGEKNSNVTSRPCFSSAVLNQIISKLRWESSTT